MTNTPLPGDFFVDQDVKRAETLPSTAFTDEQFLRRELQTIFRRTWLLVPPTYTSGNGPESTDLLRLQGSRVPFSLSGKALFLSRGLKGQLHCFPNVCTHAWHTLVASPTVGGAIICPQHGRQFDDQGRFLSQTGFERSNSFPRESDHLQVFQIAEWAPFIFTCLGNPVAPFREFLGEVQQSAAGVRLEKLRRHPLPIEAREVDGNWKQHAWNYMDNFHIRYVHKGPGGLADAIDLASYRTELFRFSSLQWAYSTNPENGINPKLLNRRFQDPNDPGRRVFALWWFIFPNMTLNFYPWGVSVNVYMPVPDKPDRTLFLWYHYVMDDEMFQRRNKTWLSEQVDSEDMEAISLVSKGAKSGFAPRGRFAPEEERGPHWFHRLVYETAFESIEPVQASL